MSAAASCCPPGAWGRLKKDQDYQDQGQVDTVDDLAIYRVGTASKCIIWNYDIFGFDSGRTRQLADALAQKGYMVVIPDWYRGQWISPSDAGLGDFIKKYSVWTKIKADLDEKVFPYAKKHGAKTFGTVGTCWGSYVGLRLTVDYPSVTACVSFHPSHSPICGMMGDDEKALLESVHAKAHHLFMPANEDHAHVKPDGLGVQVLKDRAEVVDFPDMAHGWTTRGDLDDDKVSRDVNKAMTLAVQFLDKYVEGEC